MDRHFWQGGWAEFLVWNHWRRSLTIFVMIACLSLWGCTDALKGGTGQPDSKFKEQVLQVIRENPEVILESVREYQKKQQQSQDGARTSFLQALKTKPAEVVAQSPVKGAKDGKTVLVEFSDFQCPYCAKADESLKQLLSKFPNRLTLVYKHFPLTSIHPEALPAAKAAWAAGQQGKFWEYHDALFAQQERLSDSLYKEIAGSLKLDLKKFESDRTSQAATDAINQDLKLGEQIGVEGTPFFMLAGEKFSGNVQLPELEALLAQAGK
jgi:protein-disulfide isomerase